MCIFCKIIAGEIPTNKIYEDEAIFAFLDREPLNPGHTLIIPKAHSTSLEEISEADLTKLVLVAKKLGRRLKEKLGYPAYNFSLNNGVESGQEIPHLHFHLIPRRADDGLKPWPRKKYQAGEAEEIAAKLKS
jgi:histidine triad (HIT) family protein